MATPDLAIGTRTVTRPERASNLKVRIYSDLHIEIGRWDAAFELQGAEDLVVLGGDIDVGTEGIRWAQKKFPHVPVVYVLGNHEYYQCDFDTHVIQCRRAAAGSNIHVLERDALDVLGIRILGCTLWTDFELLGPSHSAKAQGWADEFTADYSQIHDANGRFISPRRTIREFSQSTIWLDEQIAAADRPVLVVTHHAPTAATTSPQFAGHISNAAFHSHADWLIRPPVRWWIHGHTHFNADVEINGVRVMTNQWGYPEMEADGFRCDGLFDLGH